MFVENCSNCWHPHSKGKDRIGEYVACWNHPDACDHAVLIYNPTDKICPDYLNKDILQCGMCKFYYENECHHKSNTEVVSENEVLILKYKYKSKDNKACKHYKLYIR